MKLIPLSKGYHSMVDDGDFKQVSQFKWHVRVGRGGATQYAAHDIKTTTSRITVFLHDFITGWGKNSVDHKDGNGLNNQRHNFRRATFSQNSKNRGKKSTNTSGFKGVSKRRYGFAAEITLKGKTVYLGYSKDPKILASLYDIAAIKNYGEFARTNKMLGLI